MTAKTAATRTLPDLLMPCPECNGTGCIYSPTWKAFNEKHAKADWRLIPQEEWPTESEESHCEECEGSGQVPTEDGAAIMELLRWRDK